MDNNMECIPKIIKPKGKLRNKIVDGIVYLVDDNEQVFGATNLRSIVQIENNHE